MSFWWRVVLAVAYLCVIAAVWLVAAPPAAAAARGSQSHERDLGTILLDDHDVPPGFELDATQSGPYEEPPTAPSWLSPIMQHAAHIRGYDRVWFHRPEHRAIIAQVVEYPIDKLAGTIGPVVALNPPGTDLLAPIGAARETLPADHWQSTIAGWMTAARLIVVGAAPEAITPGFGWELHAVDSPGLWSKTLLVLPPVPDTTMQTRWDWFTTVLTDTTMTDQPTPSDPARTLMLLGAPAAGWSAVIAEQRTEWTYAEALTVATTMTTSMLTTPKPEIGP